MVIKEDGSKWACQSCLKGHRVSGCTHTDRPLQFVPKKGRPVTQCQHCRVERKKRSAHVKCDCGEKAHPKEKCVHLRAAEATELSAVKEAEDSDGHTCCCSHGEQCVCFNTNDHPTVARPKPRLNTTQSEGTLTVFANGPHKPIHRNHNHHAAHDANVPYRVHKPQPHAVHGLHAAGRRSVDSLVSSDKVARLPLQWIQQLASTDNAPAVDPGFDNFTTMPTSSSDDFALMPSEAVLQDDANNAYPQSALSDVSGNFNWDTLDWTALQSMNTNQPALTYASSGTVSETGSHTPPDDTVPGFNLPSRNSIVGDNSTHASTPAQTDEGLAAMAPQADMNNRWSVPASLWLPQPNDNPFGTSNVNEIKDNVTSGDLFQELDLAMPTNSTDGQLSSGELSMYATPDYSSVDGKFSAVPPHPWQNEDDFYLQFSGQTMQPNLQSSVANFGYTSESDVSEAMYAHGQPGEFYNLDSTETYAQSFGAPSDSHEHWSA